MPKDKRGGRRAGDKDTDHIKKRKKKIERNISDTAINNVIKHPLYKSGIFIDEYGRPSRVYIGEKITVIINPDTGARITVRRTTKNERKKYRKKGSKFDSKTDPVY